MRPSDRCVGLHALGSGIHAVFYKAGEPIGQRDLGHEVEVLVPTDEELADRPRVTPDFAEYAGGSHLLKFTGFYVVPGSGLAAIFGAGDGPATGLTAGLAAPPPSPGTARRAP